MWAQWLIAALSTHCHCCCAVQRASIALSVVTIDKWVAACCMGMADTNQALLCRTPPPLALGLLWARPRAACQGGGSTPT